MKQNLHKTIKEDKNISPCHAGTDRKQFKSKYQVLFFLAYLRTEETIEDLLLQNNKSAILLQKNWPFWTGKGSKHIHVRYFFVVNKIKNKEVRIIHCSTEEMVADFNTKPLQGMIFIYFRNKTMGIKSEEYDMYKRAYKEVLIKQCDLFENKEDLFTI